MRRDGLGLLWLLDACLHRVFVLVVFAAHVFDSLQRSRHPQRVNLFNWYLFDSLQRSRHPHRKNLFNWYLFAPLFRFIVFCLIVLLTRLNDFTASTQVCRVLFLIQTISIHLGHCWLDFSPVVPHWRPTFLKTGSNLPLHPAPSLQYYINIVALVVIVCTY